MRMPKCLIRWNTCLAGLSSLLTIFPLHAPAQTRSQAAFDPATLVNPLIGTTNGGKMCIRDRLCTDLATHC